ncbi:hypothetical protein [Halorhodospira halochloris]|nr:hypothetical protein [Halorhodospira halochloris]
MHPSLEASWRHPWRQDLHSRIGHGTAGRGGPTATASSSMADLTWR